MYDWRQFGGHIVQNIDNQEINFTRKKEVYDENRRNLLFEKIVVNIPVERGKEWEFSFGFGSWKRKNVMKQEIIFIFKVKKKRKKKKKKSELAKKEEKERVK